MTGLSIPHKPTLLNDCSGLECDDAAAVSFYHRVSLLQLTHWRSFTSQQPKTSILHRNVRLRAPTHPLSLRKVKLKLSVN